MSVIDEKEENSKNDIIEMWSLVKSQVDDAGKALLNFDADLAHGVLFMEKRVNSLDLKIDKDTEKIMALHNPLAKDLRLILTIMRISLNLERIGDLAVGIAKFVLELENEFKSSLLEASGFRTVFDTVNTMIDKSLEAFTEDNVKLLSPVLKSENKLNTLAKEGQRQIVDYAKKNVEQMQHVLFMSSSISKMERIGDHIENICEDLYFHSEAIVLRHASKKSKT